MQSGVPGAALVAALALCACRGDAKMNEPVVQAPAASSVSSPGSVSAPSLLWQQASRINILCQLSTAADNRDAMEKALCERVRSIAAPGAPVPVSVAVAPDAATLGDAAVVLLVQASVESLAGRPLLTFSIRPFRLSAGDGAALFGTAPRAVPLEGAGISGSAVEAALHSSLAEILPWLAGGNAPRPL